MKIELDGEIQQLVKQISNLSGKLLAKLKALKTRAKSNEDSVNHIVQLGEIKNQVCISEESLIAHMHDASRQDSQSETESNERTFAEVTVNNVDLQTLQSAATEEITAEARDQTFTVNMPTDLQYLTLSFQRDEHRCLMSNLHNLYLQLQQR